MSKNVQIAGEVVSMIESTDTLAVSAAVNGGTVSVGGTIPVSGTVSVGGTAAVGLTAGTAQIGRLTYSLYMGGTAAACGTTSTQVTIPAGSTSALVHAAGAAVYWQINGASAGTTSPGYVAQDQTGLIPPVSNLGTLHVYGAAAASVAHVEFYQD